MALRSQAGNSVTENSTMVIVVMACSFLAAICLASIAEQLGAEARSIMLGLPALVFLAYAVLALAIRSEQARDLYLAGRAAPAFCNGLALAASWGGLAAGTVLIQSAYFNGFDALPAMLGLTAGLVLLAVLLGPYLWRSGAVTVPELLGLRFGGTVRAMASVAAVVCMGALLLVALRIGAGLAGSAFGIADHFAFAGLLILALILILPGGVRSATYSQTVQGLLFAGAFLVPLAVICWWTFGLPVPPLAYGAALAELPGLEEQLVEAGAVDFATFRPHLNPFVQIDQINAALLALCIALGTAAMPHLLAHAQSAPTAHASRMSVAWPVLFCVVLLTAVPAYAAIAKLDIYRAVAGKTALTNLPDWMVRATQTDTIRIHGVSLAQLEAVTAAVQSGANTPAAVAGRIEAGSSRILIGWTGLPEPVQASLFGAALQVQGRDAEARSQVFTQTVLPAAAEAAGAATGELTLAALTVDAGRFAVSFPHIFGMPVAVSAAVLTGVLSAALAAVVGLVTTLAVTIGHDFNSFAPGTSGRGQRGALLMRLAAVAVAACAGIAMPLMSGVALIDLLVLCFSLAAGVLFPALFFAIWWPRANGWGVAAGLVAGGGVAAYYFFGAGPYAASFAETWAPVSNASPEALAEFAELQSALVASDQELRAAALADLQARAAGTMFAPGLANWFGVAQACAAIFGIFAGIVVTILVSLVTPGPSPSSRALVSAMHDPRHVPDDPFDEPQQGGA